MDQEISPEQERCPDYLFSSRREGPRVFFCNTLANRGRSHLKRSHLKRSHLKRSHLKGRLKKDVNWIDVEIVLELRDLDVFGLVGGTPNDRDAFSLIHAVHPVMIR